MSTTTTTPAATITPLTAIEFTMKYDEDHTYPFFENDNGAVIGYGHTEPAEFAAAVNAYWAHANGAGFHVDDRCDGTDVAHLWAAPIQVGGEDAISLEGVTSSTPGAVPITMVDL